MTTNKLRFITIIALLNFFYNCSFANSGEIDCYNESNIQSREMASAQSDMMGNTGNKYVDGIGAILGLLSKIEQNTIYCVRTDNKLNDYDSSIIFYNKLKNKQLIPVFLYDGLIKKYYTEDSFSDKQVMKSDKKSKSILLFKFNDTSVKSRLDFFGFYQPESENYILWKKDKDNNRLSPTNNNDFSEISKYLKNRDSTRSINDIILIADAGELDSQEQLCWRFFEGNGVKQDFKSAFNYCSMAAKKGSVFSINSLGVLYQNGLGVDQNYDKAIEYYFNAAEKNLPAAFHNLGFMAYHGLGTKVNYKNAFKLFQKAAKKEFHQSEIFIAHMFENGLGTEKNLKTAIHWYTIAAKNGDAKAQYKLAQFYEGGIVLQQNYQEAKFWYGKAAQNGNKDAQLALQRFQ